MARGVPWSRDGSQAPGWSVWGTCAVAVVRWAAASQAGMTPPNRVPDKAARRWDGDKHTEMGQQRHQGPWGGLGGLGRWEGRG